MLSVLSFIFLAQVSLAPTAVSSPSPRYFVVTTGGDVLEALAAPKKVGRRVDILLSAGGGTLTSLPESQIDWTATERRNAVVAPASAPDVPAATPSKKGLQQLASGLKVDGSLALSRQERKDAIVRKDGKMIVVGNHYFADDSVRKYIDSLQMWSDLDDCPTGRAILYASLRNASKVKLRSLRVMFVIGDPATRQTTEAIQSLDPPDLMPGETGEVGLFSGCEWARPNSQYVFLVTDVSGRTEPLAKPDGTNPLLTPVPNPIKGATSERLEKPTRQNLLEPDKK